MSLKLTQGDLIERVVVHFGVIQHPPAILKNTAAGNANNNRGRVRHTPQRHSADLRPILVWSPIVRWCELYSLPAASNVILRSNATSSSTIAVSPMMALVR